MHPSAAANKTLVFRATRLRLAVLALAAIALVAACSSGKSADKSAGNSSSAAPSGASSSAFVTPKTGGNVTMLVNGLSATLDPAINQLYSFTDGPPMSAIYSNLAYFDPTTGAVHYYLLKNMTPNADFTVWTMTLNPNIKFSDGTPLNAQAIMFNYQRIADPASSSFYAPLARTLKLQVLDDLDLQITLPSSNSYFPGVVAEDLSGIASPTAVQAEGKNYAINPVGAGPFKLKTLTAGQTIVVERNPYFSSFKPGEPYLDQITFQYLPDVAQQNSAMASGQAQIAIPTGGTATTQMSQISGLNFFLNKTGGGQDVLMNTAIAPFNDPDARQAIAYALPRAQAADAFAAGTPVVTNFFPKTSPFYDAKYNWPADDPAKAQQLFDKLAAEGKPLDFTFETIAAALQAPFANFMIAALAQYKNVKVTVHTVPAAQYTQDYRNGRYQMINHGLFMVSAVPDATDYLGATGIANTEKWNDPTAEAAIQEILHTAPTETATLKKDWGIVQQEVIAQNPVFFIGQGLLGFATNKSLINVEPMNYPTYVIWGDLGYKQ